MDYLLSIIVPTKNRYKYLNSIIESFRNMDNGEVELVIQDNSDKNEEIIQFLSMNPSYNIKYYHYKEHMPISQNFNIGVLNSLGKYVCMIGDDDTISSNLIEFVKYMDINDIDSAIFNKAKYHWPDLKFRTHKIPSLIVPKCSGEIININIQEELEKCLRKGTTSLSKLPQVYQGVVKRNTLDKIFVKCNTYFPGASPDMAIAIALSLVVKSHVYVDMPYIVSGQAFNSAGGKGARHEHSGRLKDIKWLPRDIEENWEVRIPMIWTGSTIYAESTHKSLKAMEKEDLIKKFNYSYQYAHFLSFNPQYRKYLKEILKGKVFIKMKILIYGLKIFLQRSIIFLKNIFITKLGISRDNIYENIKTSYDASEIIDDFIENKYKNVKK